MLFRSVILLYRHSKAPVFFGDYVGNDDFDAAYKLGRYILEMGHRNIGLICGPQNLTTGVERHNGFLKAMSESGIIVPKSMVFFGDFYQESGINGARKLLTAKKKPSLLAVMNNAMAFGVMTYLRQSGIEVPETVSMVSLGDIVNRELLYFLPTVISQNPLEIGKIAGRFLLQRILNPNKKPESVMIPGKIVIGNSVYDFRQLKPE